MWFWYLCSVFYVCTVVEKYDVVLSSGWLSFASHSGFLRGLEEVCHMGNYVDNYILFISEF